VIRFKSDRLLCSLVTVVLATALWGCVDGQAAGPRPEFDGEAALALVKTQTDFGPRVPGTSAHVQMLEWMESMLQSLAPVVQRQPFTAYNPHSQESVPAFNLLASFNTASRQRIMLCAHWDSRPVADHETPPVDEPIDGAVDGASGTAVLLQLARILSVNEPRYGVDIVFFDAEDTGLTNAWPEYENWFQGSRYFSQVANQNSYRPWFGILVDLIGAEGAVFQREQFSMQYAPDVVDRVWDLAASLGVSQFQSQGTSSLYDDHWILNRDANIPTINITADIYSYPHWHTRQDTYDKVSAESLAAVGKVLVALLFPE
jgi:hypothetical protein